MQPQSLAKPAKKQSKWSPEEDARIIRLRGEGMKWEEISTHLPGRSSISCRLHYQNYLEKKSVWDEEKKNKLALVYERLKPQIWSKVAEELGVPWRAAEAMHWQLGEAEMTRRAGASPFVLASGKGESNQRNVLLRRQSHPIPQDGSGQDFHSWNTHPQQSVYNNRVIGVPMTVAPRRGSPTHSSSFGTPLAVKPPLPLPSHAAIESSAPRQTPTPIHTEGHYQLGPGLAPIHSQSTSRPPDALPGIAELTTSIPMYDGPRRAAPTRASMGAEPRWEGSIGGGSHYMEPGFHGLKRRASPQLTHEEMGHRKHRRSG